MLRSVLTRNLIIPILCFAMGAAHALELDLTDESEGGESAVNFDYLIANGEMKQRDPSIVRQILNRRAKQGRRTVILFTSHGGYLEMTESLANAILEPSEELYRRHKLSNLFVVNEVCASACTALTALLTSKLKAESLIFYAAANAEFGFHSPVDKIKGKPSKIKNSAEREAAIKRQVDFLKSAGVSPEWLEQNSKMFRDEKMTIIPAKKLCAERSMVIPPDSCLPEEITDPVMHIDSLLAGKKSSLEVPSSTATLEPQQEPLWLKPAPNVD